MINILNNQYTKEDNLKFNNDKVENTLCSYEYNKCIFESENFLKNKTVVYSSILSSFNYVNTKIELAKKIKTLGGVRYY